MGGEIFYPDNRSTLVKQSVRCGFIISAFEIFLWYALAGTSNETLEIIDRDVHCVKDLFNDTLYWWDWERRFLIQGEGSDLNIQLISWKDLDLSKINTSGIPSVGIELLIPTALGIGLPLLLGRKKKC